MRIVPMRDLKDTTKIETLCAEANAPIFVTKNGYGKLVVMDIDYFNNLIDQIYEAKAINDGIKDLRYKKLKDGNAVLSEIKQKYGFK